MPPTEEAETRKSNSNEKVERRNEREVGERSAERMSREAQEQFTGNNVRWLQRNEADNDAARAALPNLTIEDGNSRSIADTSAAQTDCGSTTDNTRAQVSQETRPDGQGQRTVIRNADGRTSYIDYDSDGRPERYTNFNGETFVRQGITGGDDGRTPPVQVWRSESNVVQPDGVELNVDSDNNVVIRDRATGIVQTTRPDGTEVTQYPGGGRTTRQIEHSGDNTNERITIDSPGRAQRTMQIENDRLVSYTDSEGNTYRMTDQRVQSDDPRQQKAIYTRYDRNGNPVDGQYTVTADRTGNVVVRHLGHEQDADYARRELNNGTVVTSSADANDMSKRRVVDASGRELDPASAEARRAQESPMIQQVPPGADLEQNRREAEEHSGINPLNNQWFWERFKYGGLWDYKFAGADHMNHPEYADFGNYNYGYAGAAGNYDLDKLEQLGGYYQRQEGTSRGEWGTPPVLIPGTPYIIRNGTEGTVPGSRYGDDPNDTRNIDRGYQAYEQRRRQQQAA
jgi:hypothetical protein